MDQNNEEIYFKESQEEYLANSQVYSPWISISTLRIHHPLVRLHNEIIEFSQFMSRSPNDSIQAHILSKKLEISCQS